MNALTDILSHQVVYRLGWTLLHLLWQAGVVALLLAILLRLLRRASANLRYIVACSALALVVVLPVVTIQLIQAPASYSAVRAESASALSPQVETEEIALLNPLAPIQAPAIPLKLRAAALLEPALPYIVAAWLFGVLTLSVWHLGGWAHLQRLKRRMVKEADAALIETLRALAAKLKVTRPVQLAESALVQIPAVVGWLRPVILLPAAAVTGLTAQQLEALLAHELAHIRRYDYLVNMLQTVVEILGFYHPAVWWLSHKIRDERENCCDDLAVNVCGDKMRYARALAEMERIRSTHGELALAANGGNLFTRICRLIGKGSAPKPRFNWAAALIAALLIVALAIPTTLAISRRRSTGADDNAATARAPDANNIPPAPPVYVTDANETRVQTLFEFKIFQVPKDSKLIKDADNVFVRCGKAFADELETLSKESKDARVLTAPRVITLEGEEAVMFVGNDMPYTAGYTEQPGKGPKPIMKTVHGGYKIRVKAEVVDNTNIRTEFIFTQTDPTFTTHKVARGQEIQIPVIKTTECSAVVTTGDGGTVFIGGLQDAEKPNQTIIIQLTPHIIRAGQTIPADDLPPNKGSKEEISFTVAPQVVTSTRVDTLDAQAFPSSRSEPVRVVEELIAMVKGQAPYSFELLNTQMAVAEQLKDLRTILADQPVEIKPVLADDKEALVTTTTVKDDRNREGQLLFHLTKQEDKWTIDDIDFETPDTLKEELARFQTRSEASKSSRRRLRPADNNSQATEDKSIMIFKLRYADCGEASYILRPLLVDMQGVTIVTDTNSNQLIINATEADLKRIADLIQKIDVEEIVRAQSGPSDIVVEIFPLEYADCEQAARLLNNLPTLDKAKIVADSRLNQLIVQASESEIGQISNLIRQLDQPIDEEAAEERQAPRAGELQTLEDQRKQLADKLKDLQQKIRQLQREQGMAELTTRQDLMLQRVASLMNELTKTESRRMQLETDLRLLEQDKDQPLPPQELLKMRQEYVNNDATVRALAEKAAQVEMELLLARQTSTNDSPEVKSKAALLEALKARLEQAKQEVAATFDNLMAKQAAETYRQKLIRAQTELEQNKSYEDRLRERLKDEDAETVRIAQIQQEIQLLRDESDSTRETYDEIGRRVMEFQTGLTSPARPGNPNVRPLNSAIEAPPPELKPIAPANQDK